MAAFVAPFRCPLSWWLPAGVLALFAVWVWNYGWPPSSQWWLIWLEILLVGLAWSAAHSRRKLSLLGVPLDRVLLWAVFGLVLAGEISSGLARKPWDSMLVTAVFAFVITIEMMDRIPMRYKAVFDRLVGRGVLAMTPDIKKACFARLEQQARKWTRLGGPGGAAIALAVWIVALSINLGSHLRFGVQLKGPVMLFSCLLGLVAGERFGRMAAYGESWRLFHPGGARWRLMPGHPDKAGGFKPIGDFFFYESIVVAVPAIYLAAWSLSIVLARTRYAGWLRPYLGLLVLAIVLEVMAFFLPMRSIHALMREQKTMLLAHADQLSRKIESLQERLCEQQPTSKRQQMKDSVTDLTEACKRIEQVPTWPIDPSIRRRFSFGNIALFLPFITFALGVFKSGKS